MGQQKLKDQFIATFSLREIESLCFDLGLNYDELPGDRLSRKVEALLIAVYKAERFPDLVIHLSSKRPKASWPITDDILAFDWETSAQDIDFSPTIQKWIRTIGNIGNRSNVIQGDYSSINVDNRTIYNGIQDIEQLPPEPGAPPYKGLQKFRENDSDWFFGRENLTSTLIKRLHDTNFLILVGASGSGKSSIARASILPIMRHSKQLDDGTVPPLGDWQIYTLAPTANPLEKLASTLLPEQYESQALFVKNLQLGETALTALVTQCINIKNGEKLFILIDQFEEIFTQCSNKKNTEYFIQNLIEASNSDYVKVLITLRADFYQHCLAYPELREVLKNSQEPIGQLESQEMADLILRPAQKGNWKFQKGLWETILSDVGNQPGRLPLLSYSLLETWKNRKGRVLTLSGYRDSGGVGGAIAQSADNVYQNANNEEKDLIKKIFLELTEIGENGQFTRRRILRSTLNHIGDERSIDKVITTLTSSDKRLVISSSSNLVHLNPIGEQQLEVAHEALLKVWPRLNDWLLENQSELKLIRQLDRDALEWDISNRDSSLLYRGGKLSRVINIIENTSVKFSTISFDFIEAGIQDEKQHYIRINKFKYSLYALGIFLFIILAINPVQDFYRQQKAINLSELVRIESKQVVLGRCDIFNSTPMRVICPEDKNGTNFTIPSFSIEKREVSNKQYKYCVDANKCTAPNSEWYQEDDYREYPVLGVDALQAHSYCVWIRRSLPTEVQWEIALGPEAADFLPDHDLRSVYKPHHISDLGIENLFGNASEWTRSIDRGLPSIKYDLNSVWDENIAPLKFRESLWIRGDNYSNSSIRDSAIGRVDDQTFGFRCVK